MATVVASLHCNTVDTLPLCTASLHIVVFAIKFLMFAAPLPWAAPSVARDDVVISTKGWVCIPLAEDIICALLCRQQEKAERWQRRAGKLLFLTPYQLSASYRSHLLLSQTITRVALFTEPRHSISLPHPLSQLALNVGGPTAADTRAGKCRWVDPHQQIEAGCVFYKIRSSPHVVDNDFSSSGMESAPVMCAFVFKESFMSE